MATNGINATDLTRTESNERTLDPIDHPFLQQAELTVQPTADRLMPHESFRDEDYRGIIKHNRSIVAAHPGQKTLSRMIFELVSKVSSVSESHILQRRNRERDRKDKIEGKVEEQKSIKNNQATAHGIEGAFTGAALLAGLLIGGDAGKLVQQIAGLSRPAKEMVVNHFDGQLIKPQHETQVHITELQSAKQAIESLKNQPEQLRNLMLDVMRQELHAVQSVSQR